MEPHGAETCQHSQLQFPMPAPMLSHDPALGRKQAKHCAFLSCCFQGKLLLSCILPHKHLNTSASTANRLQRCGGNVYNYPWFVHQPSLQPLMQLLIKKTRCRVFCFLLHLSIFYNGIPGWCGVGFFDRFRESVYCFSVTAWLNRYIVFCPTTQCIKRCLVGPELFLMGCFPHHCQLTLSADRHCNLSCSTY